MISEETILHPTIIDAMIQCGLFSSGQVNTLSIFPVSVKGFRILGKDVLNKNYGEIFTITEIVSKTNNNIVAKQTCFDSEFNPLVEISELEYQLIHNYKNEKILTYQKNKVDILDNKKSNYICCTYFGKLDVPNNENIINSYDFDTDLICLDNRIVEIKMVRKIKKRI